MLHTLALGRQAAALFVVHRCAHRIPKSWEPPSPGELGLVFPRTPLAILVRRRAKRLRSACVRVSTCRPLFHLNSDRCGTRLPRYSLREPCMVCHIAVEMRWRDVTPTFPGVTSSYRAMPRCTPPRIRTGNLRIASSIWARGALVLRWLVRMTGFEPAAFSLATRRAASCATSTVIQIIASLLRELNPKPRSYQERALPLRQGGDTHHLMVCRWSPKPGLNRRHRFTGALLCL